MWSNWLVSSAVVVGSGPNGLAAAVALAGDGLEVSVIEAADTIGGGTRTSELTLPGLLHDHCSAFHPFAIGSPFLRSLDLERHGVTWRWCPVDLAHPLDHGRAAAMMRSVDATAQGLGADGALWRQLFAPLAEAWDAVAAEVLVPVAHIPRHPSVLARLAPAALPATVLARSWRKAETRALFAGAAAHSLRPLSRPATSAIGLLLIAAGHRFGWPMPEGGSRSITDALARILRERGGRIETGRRVGSLAELGHPDLVMLDLDPRGVVRLTDDALPARVRHAYGRYRYGPGAFKLDLAVEGGIPWASPACRSAATVHVGGRLAEIAAAERQVNLGQMPARPFVLVGQQYLADPTRSNGNLHPVWAYAHVPHGYPGDATAAVLAQIERFAPGTRERVVAATSRRAIEWTAYNSNFVEGDIAAGANTVRQLVFRPRVSLEPYATGIPGVFICSAATPPGAGVHGMGGANAARAALRWLVRHGRGR